MTRICQQADTFVALHDFANLVFSARKCSFPSVYGAIRQVGIGFAFERRNQNVVSKNTAQPISMKKQDRKLHRQTMNLGDLIAAVSSCAKNNRETVATVVDLLASGQVLMQCNGHSARAQLIR